MLPTDADLPLFCFGSLMHEPVLGIVTGQNPNALRIEDAVALDHRQLEVVDESFPILAPAAGHDAAGRLVHGLDATALDRVLFFEGEEYALAPLTVRVAGKPRAARYFRDTGAYRTTGAAWDFEAWRRDGLARFLDHTTRYMALFGELSIAEADARWLELQGD